MGRSGGIGLHAFVGREPELASLLLALDAAERGEGGVYLLRGEAGIGKSRTSREVVGAARERGFAVGIGACPDSAAAPAYEPWVRALRDTPVGDVLEDRRASGAAPRGDDESDDERDALFRRVEASLREDAAGRPRLLLLEDLHWADVDSLRLLHHLARRLEGCAWMALCTQREDEPLDDRRRRALAALARDARAIPLGPLDESEVADLVAHRSGRTPEPELVRAARERSGGNPLFLCELIALVVSQGRPMSVAALESAGVPAVLRDLLERRLEHLPAATTARLARAAVLGDPFELAELSTWLREAPGSLLAALEPAERLRMVEPSGDFADRFRFTHSLVRDAVLALRPRTERAVWHREVAAMLEATGRDRSEPELARLAEHHRHGVTASSAQRAVECAAAAALLARQQGAPEQAVRHLLLALDSLPGVEASAEELAGRRCDLLLSLGEAYSQTGERSEAYDAHLEAARLAQRLTRSDALARAAIGMVGRDEDPRGASAELERWVEVAREALDPVDTPLRAGVLALASRLAGGRGEAQRAVDLAREAVAIAERLDRPDTSASASHALHKAILDPEGLPERLALSERMVAAAERGPSRRTELRARQRRFTDWLQVGDIAAADEELARVEALARAYDRPAFRWHALTLAASSDLWRGRLESAEHRITEAFAQGRRAGMRNAQALFSVQMFHLRERQGRLGELRPGLQEMVERNPQIPSLPLVVPLAAMQEGNELLARSTFEPLAARDFEDVPRDVDWLPVMSSHARVAAYLRDCARCQLLLEKLRPYRGWCVTLPDGQDWEGSVAFYLALLERGVGESDAARSHLQEALDCHRRAGALPLVAETLHELAGLDAEAGDAASARERWGEALALHREMGASLFAERAQEALNSLVGSAAPRTAPVDGVSRRFERRGPHWTIEYAGRRTLVEHRKGMSDLAALLRTGGREIHALELMVAERGAVDSVALGAEAAQTGTGPAALPGVDPTALAQYRGRLAELRAEREDAVACSDLAKRRATEGEIAWLERELRRAFGEGRDGSSAFAQKARKAVYNRIRAAIAAIADVHPELGRHLRHSIRTGVVCAYRPESPEEWLVRDERP